MTPPTDPARWFEIKRLFEAALDEPADARATFLDQACRAEDHQLDAELRAAVERLLAADADAEATAVTQGGFLAASPLELGGLLEGLEVELAEAPVDAEPGTRIGPYRVIRLLGRGGMGEVYLAARADGLFERTVALKRVRADLAPGVAARFSTERQILADLVHPGIARLYDAGVGEDGLPWLALENVEGVPITEAVQSLGLHDRIDLLADVAEAVHHAHRRLVVHRDLKPSNVLVTEGEEGRQVKLLDFGIAQILGADSETDERPDRRPMTRAYAAPEQLRGDAVTTTTDVYGLGLLLYEALTGTRPFPTGGSMHELEAPPPIASSTAPGGVDLGESREDLDAICRMALAVEPELRYASAEAFAADLRRVLSHQPVAARPPSAAYRSSRFVRRHRLGVASTVFVALAIAAGTAFYTVRLAAERDRAERAATEAQRAATEADRTAGFLESLFADADPTGADPGDRTARDLLDAGDARVRDELASEPGVLAGLLATIGRVHLSLGRFAEADSALVDAVALYEQTGRDPMGHRDGLLLLANLRFRTETYDEAETYAREAFHLDSLHAQPVVTERLAILNTLGLIHHETRRLESAAVLLREVVDGRRQLADPEAAVDLASNLSNLGVVLLDLERPAEALPLFDESVDLVKEHRGEGHPYVAFALHSRAGVHEDLGNLELAEADERRALEIGEAALGPDHPFCVQIRGQLAELVARRSEAGP